MSAFEWLQNTSNTPVFHWQQYFWVVSLTNTAGYYGEIIAAQVQRSLCTELMELKAEHEDEGDKAL